MRDEVASSLCLSGSSFSKNLHKRPKQPDAAAIVGSDEMKDMDDCSKRVISDREVNALLIVNWLR